MMIKKLTLSAMTCAMGISLLWLGSIFDIASVSMAAIAGMLILIVHPAGLGWYEWLIYAATGILSLILIPVKDAAVFYIMFFGIYSIMRRNFAKIRIKWLRLFIKAVFFNLSLFAMASVFFFLFAEPSYSPLAGILMVLACNLFFWLYDYAIDGTASAISRRIFKK